MNLSLIVVVLVAGLVMAAGMTVYQKQMARKYAVEAVRALLQEYRGALHGEAERAMQGFTEQARQYRLADAQRQDVLAGMLHRVTGVEAALGNIYGLRDEPGAERFESKHALETYLRLQDVPSSKRGEILFAWDLDPARAVREAVLFGRLQDLTALRAATTAMQKAFEKARPYLPPAILNDYSLVHDRSRSLSLTEDVQDERSWDAARATAAGMAETIRRLPEALRRELARPLSAGTGGESASSAA